MAPGQHETGDQVRPYAPRLLLPSPHCPHPSCADICPPTQMWVLASSSMIETLWVRKGVGHPGPVSKGSAFSGAFLLSPSQCPSGQRWWGPGGLLT